MSLIAAPPQWAYCTDNLPSTPSPTATGTAVTCGANNSDGSTVSVMTLTHDAEYLVIGFAAQSSQSGVNSSSLVDVLVDTAGGTSWEYTLIEDLLAGFVAQTGSGAPLNQRQFQFPIWIPAGASIGIRGRTAHSGSFILRCNMWAYGGNRNPASWWCGQRVVTYGSTPASSIGTAHTAGNSGAYSSWATIAASTEDHQAFCWAVQGIGSTTQSTLAYHFQFGVGGSQLGGTYYKQTLSTEGSWDVNPGVVFAPVPSGTNLQVRGTCSASAEALDVAIYGIS